MNPLTASMSRLLAIALLAIGMATAPPARAADGHPDHRGLPAAAAIGDPCRRGRRTRRTRGNRRSVPDGGGG